MPVSRGDALNYCEVVGVELRGAELVVAASVVGVLQPASWARVTTLGQAGLQLPGRAAAGEPAGGAPGTDEDETALRLAFDCPAELQRAEDVLFCYAPGYSTVSILDSILGSLLDDLLSDCGSPGTAPAAPEPTAPARAVQEACQAVAWAIARASSRGPAARPALEPAADSARDSEGSSKREDGFTQRRSSSGSGLLRPQHQPSGAALARAEALCAAVEGGHGKLAAALDTRARCLRALRGCWPAGDAAALAAQLGPDDGVHALSAMRFVLAVLELAWPSVSKGLRDVATPRAELDACQGVVARLSALFAVVKSLTRSVRVSRANGPLPSVCKQLRSALESALAAEGRVPGRAPPAAQPKAVPAGGTRLRCGQRDPAARLPAARSAAAAARERPAAETELWLHGSGAAAGGERGGGRANMAAEAALGSAAPKAFFCLLIANLQCWAAWLAVPLEEQLTELRAVAKVGGGKGGLAVPLAAGAVPQLSLQDATQLAELSRKAGDLASAEKYGQLARKLHDEAHPAQKRQQDLDNQYRYIELLRQKLQEADDTYKATSTSSSCRALSDMVDPSFDLGKIIELDGPVADASLESEMAPEDLKEIEDRRGQLGEAVQKLAEELLGPLAGQARPEKGPHKAHMQRLAARRRRAGAPQHGAAAAAEVSAAGGKGALE
ncbi:unnamed protein product [Prorocentrum cordatum]|uniref:Uncharacterized protein n=1 Tax=Prorocentrum cordatum TaxID=2364126 RepID=A0ABN9WJL2_9DINO|nr:unnamed protein product [Polarella glacialis]